MTADVALARLARLRHRWPLDPGLVIANVAGAMCVLGLVNGRTIGLGCTHGCLVEGVDNLADWFVYLIRLGPKEEA